MEARDLRLRKNKMENDIMKFIQKEITSFNEASGLNVSKVDVSMTNVSTIGKDDEFVLTGVTVEVRV